MAAPTSEPQGVPAGSMAETDHNAAAAAPVPAQAVRFSSVNQEFEPAYSLQSLSTLGPDNSSAQQEVDILARQRLMDLAQSLQKHRTSNFAFEPVSLPASRVPSNEASAHAPPLTGSSFASLAAPQLQSPPLTPAKTQSHDTERNAQADEVALPPRTYSDPVIMTPQMSPRKETPPPSQAKEVRDKPQPSSAYSSQPTTPSEPSSSRPSPAPTGPENLPTRARHSHGFSIGPTSTESSRDDGLSSSRASSGIGASFSKPFTPAGDKDDPYARSKRPPQPRTREGIDSRFVFGGRDSRGGHRHSSSSSTLPRSSLSGSDLKSLGEKRHSFWRKDHDESQPSPTHSKHGSMADLKRFFQLPHKIKRSHSPASSPKTPKSAGWRTPTRQKSTQSTVPFSDDHLLSLKYGKIGKVLGSGAGGSVRLMKRTSDGVVFAVKEFRPKHAHESEKEYGKKVTAEFCVGSTLHHGNVIETLDIFNENGRWYEVMEYAPYDLFAMVMTGKMSKEEISCAFLQILTGVTYLHSMGLAHRDLKLDNVVVSQYGIMKIIDFGSATVFRYPFETDIVPAQGVVGSDPYLAPEVYEGAPYDPQPVDIWSLAIVFCCMTLRRFPWKLPRPSDNSFRLFTLPPLPGYPGAPERPKSTPNLPSLALEESKHLAESQPASRQPSGVSSHQHHHHHHHHRPAKDQASSDPVSQPDEKSGHAPPSSDPVTPAPQQPVPSNAIHGPWRLLRLLPRDSRQIIGRMLDLDPKTRATLEEIYSDPWVLGNAVCRQEPDGRVVHAPGHVHTLEPSTAVASLPSKGGET